MLEHYWVLILFPLIGAVVNGIFGRSFAQWVIAWISCLASGLSFLVGLLTFLELRQQPSEARTMSSHLFTWIESGDLVVECSFLLDPLSMVMILIITGIGFLIHLYSVAYMAGEDGYYRYFAYLNLFIFMMSILVLADNYLLMFVGWEGVGLCSYLLIGYYFEKPSAGNAAKKAFLINRVGDVGFILGAFLIFRHFGTFAYRPIFATITNSPESVVTFSLGTITLLLFIGAIGKSAQIPLHIWLPDAMEGPTPVSALIHAATMVTAGIYMIARSAPLYSRAPETLFVIAIVGTVTALIAALIALTERDIKKVLAYSTISQLGYMFIAVGVGAFGASIFHLITHAFFKALLFLGSGSVILALHHEQNIFRMGGLRKYLRATFYSMWIATLAIMGAPFFSGFFSKDQILWKTFESPHGNIVFLLVEILVVGLTAFYMSRLMFLVFYGREQFQVTSKPHMDPHEPSSIMTVPLMILAFFSIIIGYIGLPSYLGINRLEEFLSPSFQDIPKGTVTIGHSYTEELVLTVVTVAIAMIGFLVAHQIYINNKQLPKLLTARLSWLYRILEDKFFIDELYNSVLIKPIHVISRKILWKAVDVSIIDGFINGIATLMQRCSYTVRRIQSGYVRTYAIWILGGTILIFLYYYLTLFQVRIE